MWLDLLTSWDNNKQRNWGRQGKEGVREREKEKERPTTLTRQAYGTKVP